jgi:orotidine-5'-phosphate decarboxylase
MEAFSQKLKNSIKRTGGCLCVGLDVDLAKLPQGIPKDGHGALKFCRSIVEATKDLAAAYKPNMAFFESLGTHGFEILELLRQSIPPETLFIADAKRGDIGNTSQAYSKAFYELLKADGVTLSPYMGKDSIDPFLDHAGTCSFVLCLTSNPSSADFQLSELKEGGKLYEKVARTAVEWGKGKKGEVGLVVGATQTQHLRDLRKLVPDTVFLVPGVGAQGGDLQGVMREGRNKEGYGIVVNVSRQILYASSGTDFADKARVEAQKLVKEMKPHFA